MIAEKAYLGTLLKENYLIQDSSLKVDHFADGRHKILFKVMKSLTNKGKAVDTVTLAMEKEIQAIGMSYLNDIRSLANPEKVDEYESLIMEFWKEREKNNILARSSNENWEINKVIAELDKINEVKTDDHTDITEALVRMYEAPWQEKSVKKGVTSGIKQLDAMTNGFQDGEVTIIAARPSMGKSDVMLHIAKQAGWTGNLPILFSLEMPEESLTDRLIASTGSINRMKMRNLYKSLTNKQKEEWPHIVARVSETNIQMFDEAGQSLSEMRSKVRKVIKEHEGKKPIIIIDYLTLIRPEEFYGGNAHLQVTEISKNLKGLAKEFKCHVICLAQLNRSVEQRQDKRPMMSDIRESGSVEQDADLIMFLYRESYYDTTVEDKTLELIIAKNRNGPIGTVETKYNKYTGEIHDVYS